MVLYGHRGTQSLLLEIEAKAAEELLKKVTVNNTILNLKVQRGWSGDVLLREVQRDTRKLKPIHLSFFAIAGHGSITLDLPLAYVGEPVGVKVDGGLLERSLTSLSVSAAPAQVPEAIEVNVGGLGVGDVLYVRDLDLPDGVEATVNLETAVATVIPSTTGRDLEALVTEETQADLADPDATAGDAARDQDADEVPTTDE